MISRDEMKEIIELRGDVKVLGGMLKFGKKLLSHISPSNPKYQKFVEGTAEFEKSVQQRQTRLSVLENRLEMEGMEEEFDLEELAAEVKAEESEKAEKLRQEREKANNPQSHLISLFDDDNVGK